MAWARLIRFTDSEGKSHFGEPEISDSIQLSEHLQNDQLYAFELLGDSPFRLSPSGRRLQVKKLLGILRPEDVPIIKCVGLNYIKHSKF
jgi:hypothetical protein